MTRIKMTVLTLFAVLAMSAIATATATAAEGEIVNSKGEPFKGTAKETAGATTFETVGGSKIKCKEFAIEPTGIIFKGCESGGVKCNSAGAAAGELVITAAEGKLPRTPAKTLVSETLLTETFEFKCALVKIQIKGGFLSASPTEKSLKTEFKVTVKQTKGIQEKTEFENEAKEKVKVILETSISGGKFEQTGTEFTETLVFSEAVEFR